MQTLKPEENDIPFTQGAGVAESPSQAQENFPALAITIIGLYWLRIHVQPG
ncbi:MAG: hypothetical protein KJN90_10440 [Gammaproteobacteria bacterium]|nr:hypothetical protein [Gammaproteobacteria bacterium]